MAVNAFSGEDDGVGPLQSIVGGARNVGQGMNDALFRDPASRTALLQIGLGLMQPTAMGQSTMGHIGQAIGSGGEAATRLDTEEQAKQKQEDAMDIAQGKLDVERQNAASYEKGVGLKGLIDRQQLQQERLAHQAAMAGNKDYIKLATEQLSLLKDPYGIADKNDPVRKKYENKSINEVADMMRQEDLLRGGGAAASPSPSGPSGKPKTIKQGGFTYELQPDGSYQ